MADTEYWFARRFPVGSPRNSMAPVSRKAMYIAWAFVGGMVLGGLCFLFLGLNGQLIGGAIVFALMAAASGSMFIGMAVTKGDKQHTVDDYKAGRVPGQKPYMS
jgi:hypothetical protein